jgi:uncharacterized protein YndB with AHSA1/START domain
MNEFEIETTVDRPVAEVFAFVTDVAKLPLYNPSVTEARWTSAGEVGVGSTSVSTGQFLGRRYETGWEVTDYKANEMLASRTVSGPFHLEITQTFDRTDGGTRINSRYRGESRGFFKLAEPVVFRIAKKQFEAAAETLKELLEAGS